MRDTTLAALVLAAGLASLLGGCADANLVKPGASLEQVEEDRAACRREASEMPKPMREEPAPTFNASSAPSNMGSAGDATGVGNAQMSDVMSRMGVDQKTFEACLRAHGFKEP